MLNKEFVAAVVRLAIGTIIVADLVMILGCRSLRRRGPVDDSVLAARHLARQGLDAAHQGDFSVAEDRLARALAEFPEDQCTRGHYAQVLWEQGKQEEALAHMQVAFDLSNGEDALSAVELGRMHLVRGEVEEAIKKATVAMRLDHQMGTAWLLRSETRLAQGQNDEALADGLRALSYSPNDTNAHLSVSRTYRILGRPHRALALLHRLEHQFSTDSQPQDFLLEKGLALLELKRFEAAKDTLFLARQKGPPSRDLFYHLAKAELGLNQWEDARESARQALELAQDDQAAQTLFNQISAAQQALGLQMRR